MKRIKNILLLMILLLFPNYVNASVATNINCNVTEVVANESFSCIVSVTPDATTNGITTFKAGIDYPTDISLIEIEPATNWTSKSNQIIDLANDNYELGSGLTTTLNIATLRFKVNNNVTYGTKEIKITGYDVAITKGYEFKILSSNNYLKSLKVSGIDFSFSSKTNIYNLETTKEVITINATLMDTNASFKKDYEPKSYNLNYGKNTIHIIVIAQNGASNTYTLNIERLDQRSENNSLKELKVSEGVISPSFNKDTLTYDVTVSNDVKSLAIEATKEVSSSNYVAGYGPRTIEIQDGLNVAQIKIKSETGAIKTYTLNITKTEKSSNNYLKAVKLSNADINFDKNIYEYNLNVLYNVLEMEIIAVAEDFKSEVQVIGNKSLIIGENTFTINVIAENGSVLSYKIVINRLEEGRELSNNNYLSELLINNYPIDFNKDITDYTIKINDENRLTISYTSEDENAQVTIQGNNALKNGSKILINVVSENKTIRTYTLNIEKDYESHFYIYIIIALLITTILLIFLFRKKIFKKKEEQIISEDINLTTSKLVLENKKDVNKENDKVDETTINEKEVK